MRTRTVREGSVGLLLLLGVGLFFGLFAWLRGLTVGQRNYNVTIRFDRVNGLQDGAVVRYRGVAIGNISRVQPRPNGVEVEAKLAANAIVPRDARVEANQSGLISQVGIDITPQTELPTEAEIAGPLDPDCDPSLIVCNGTQLEGVIGISTDELIRYSTRFLELYSEKELFSNVNATLKNTSELTAEVAQLSRELSTLTRTTRKQLDTLSGEVTQITDTADQTLTKFGTTAEQLQTTAAQINRLTTSVDNLLTTNRSTLVSALNNLNQTSAQLKTAVSELSPTINRVTKGELINNLETLSANAAAASEDLRQVSNTLNAPTNLVVLQQTLDSARVTFQNAQKISSDLDELTGDPQFRDNVRELVNGLSTLVSSTQQLQQQVQVAENLDSVNTTVNLLKSDTQSSSKQRQALIEKLKQSLDANHQVKPLRQTDRAKLPSPEAN